MYDVTHSASSHHPTVTAATLFASLTAQMVFPLEATHAAAMRPNHPRQAVAKLTAAIIVSKTRMTLRIISSPRIQDTAAR